MDLLGVLLGMRPDEVVTCPAVVLIEKERKIKGRRGQTKNKTIEWM